MGIFGAIAAIDAVAGATTVGDHQPPKGLDPLSAMLAKEAVADMPQIRGAGDVLSTPGIAKSQKIEIV